MTYEDLVFKRNSFANEGMAGDLAVPADGGPFLNLDKSPDFCIVPDLASVEIDKVMDKDAFPQPYIISDASKHMQFEVHLRFLSA